MMKNNRQDQDNTIIRAVLTVALVGAFTLPLQGCNEDVPVAEPFGPTPAGVTRMPVEELDATTKEAVILGGRLYDNLFSVSGANPPTENNPMAVYMDGDPADTTKPRGAFVALDGVDPQKPAKPTQYRCATCHGFTYLGSEFSDVGIMDAANNKTLEEIQAIISDGISFKKGSVTSTIVHDYGGYVSSADIEKLATFIKYGVVDIGNYIYAFGPVGKGNEANGKALYSGAAGCAGGSCHGALGKNEDFSDHDPSTTPNEFVGTIGQTHPDEMLHKIRFGQPSEPRKGGMPTIYDSGLTTQDAADIMTYTQQLPAQ